MKTAHFQAVISPAVGTLVAGYGAHDVSVMKHDELMLHGVCFDDGDKKALLISYDLIGLGRETVVDIRRRCAPLIGGTEADVMLSCTHTHGGPHTRPGMLAPADPEAVRIVTERTVAAVAALGEKDFVEGDLYAYSVPVHANINRRYTGPDNVCRMLFENRELEPLADGVCDPELGIMFLLDRGGIPREIIVNYAAHPLASHTPGTSGHAITADYPGLLRRYLTETTGANALFVSGAAGDQFPMDSEIGFQNLDVIAKPLARETVRGLVNGRCNPQRFKLENPKLRTMLKNVPVGIREPAPHPMERFRKSSTYDLELQLLAVGDIVWVGVPGELLAELGLEIKWHSPFKRAYICYNSTDYANYICHANALVAGGYEADQQQFDRRSGLQLVNAAVDAMFELKTEKY